jgi:hypothetical protein
VQQDSDAGTSFSAFLGLGGMWGPGGSTALQGPPAAAAALPVLTAADMFVWQAPQSGHSSSRSSTRACEQQQWLSPASCFCEGL